MLKSSYIYQIQKNLNQIVFDRYESDHLLDHTELKPIICFLLVTLYSLGSHGFYYLSGMNSSIEHAVHVMHQLHLITINTSHETKIPWIINIHYVRCSLTSFGTNYTQFLFKNPNLLYRKQKRSNWLLLVIPLIIIWLISAYASLDMITDNASFIYMIGMSLITCISLSVLFLVATVYWYIGTRKIFSGKRLSKCDFLRFFRKDLLTNSASYVKCCCNRFLFDHPYYHVNSTLSRHDGGMR